ncbi:hypothetical protein Slin15195_G021100 [Septoria linicola]|uniref:Uncharacterized protein n=1 Tax=Septoria linicola TaxID=215465 RepID=A0A9Q9AQ63_9PEZI|nr:hypothetical protein Slin14017_G021160 [Septoria linicola]USW48791.1 hypothetical protein Slin15195_G021100 [Septoria linicola]
MANQLPSKKTGFHVAVLEPTRHGRGLPWNLTFDLGVTSALGCMQVLDGEPERDVPKDEQPTREEIGTKSLEI